MAVQRLPAMVAAAEWLPVPMDVHVAAVLVTLFFAMVLAVALGWMDWARWRWLTAAGALTYPLYLIHQFIGYNLIHWLASRVERHVVLGGVALAMLVVAWLIHRLIERPLAPRFDRALTKAIADLRREPSPPEAREHGAATTGASGGPESDSAHDFLEAAAGRTGGSVSGQR